MEPHRPVAGQVTNLISTGDTSVAVNFHGGSNGANIPEEAVVHEDIDGGLVVE